MIFLYVFLLGAIIGSFLNVCIYRIPKNESINFPPSHCPKCKERIKWYDNIPILSYLVLRGKCRVCKSKISVQYPIIEALVGIFFVLVYVKFGYSLNTIKYFVFISLLLCVSIIDIKNYYIPDIFSFSLIILGIASANISYLTFEQAYIGASAYAMPFIVIYGFGEYIFKKEAMGFGDVKLACGIGAFLGYLGFYNLYLWFTLTFVLGSLISLGLIGFGLKDRKSQIAFAPFMSMSAFVMLLLL